MNWRILNLLSLAAVGMALLAIFGITTRNVEMMLWLVVCVLGAWVLIKEVPEEKGRVHALLLGVMWGLINGLLQSFLFDTYLANNPAITEQMSEPMPVPAPVMPIFSSLIAGMFSGVLMTGIMMVMRRFTKKEGIS
ncbi:hypothetical protein [Pontibacter sp. G13]|uniref:hypothetical protein n=1 Tax=Pontibacter sp. G13 TaxID=3074898 RepID=UPI00288BA5AD|nr:hypothetical protein [Pontibacter sp. G13]WNJ18139.1 hypothetical protein RJD25_25080 [Pontibacter sp. G13]